jgi:hypothetical protein
MKTTGRFVKNQSHLSRFIELTEDFENGIPLTFSVEARAYLVRRIKETRKMAKAGKWDEAQVKMYEVTLAWHEIKAAGGRLK